MLESMSAQLKASESEGRPWPALIIIILMALSFSAPAHALDLSGWAELSYYPPHNERTFPYIRDAHRHARYGLEAYVVAGQGRFFVFARPLFLFGYNLPQRKYTNRADPIGADPTYGGGVRLTDSLDLRVTHHENVGFMDGGVQWDLPWNSVSIRWTF